MHLAQHGKLTLDSKKLKGTLEDFLQKENRFSTLTRKNPEASAKLHHHLQVSARRHLRGATCWLSSWPVFVVAEYSGSRYICLHTRLPCGCLTCILVVAVSAAG